MAILTIAIAFLGINGVGYMLVLKREHLLDRSWAAALLPFESLKESFPKAAQNGAAIELEIIAARLGVELAPFSPTAQAETAARHPTAKTRGDLEAIAAPLGRFVMEALQTPNDSIRAMPAELLGFMTVYANDLTSLRTHILGGDLPRWEMDASKGDSQAYPNSVGLKLLHELLIAEALRSVQMGDSPTMLANLRASWRLNEAIDKRPELAQQVDAVWASRLQAATLRKGGPVNEDWVTSLFRKDYLRATLIAIEYQALEGAASIGQCEGAPGILCYLRPRGRRRRAAAAAYEAKMLSVVKAFGRQDPCHYSWTVAHGDNPPETRESTELQKMAVHWVFRLLVERELSAQVMEVKHVLAGFKPASVPVGSVVPSAVCRGSYWRRDELSGGAVRISFSGDFEEWPASGIFNPPLNYTVARQ